MFSHLVARRNETKFIAIDKRLCTACWKCVDTCPNHVLGKVDLLGHRHVHVDAADQCKGCVKCVRVCPNGAIVSLRKKQAAAHAAEQRVA